MKYGTVSLGQIEALLNKIGGFHCMLAILSGKMEITTRWKKCWQTVQLGTYPHAESLRKALVDAGHDPEKTFDFSSIEIGPARSVDLVLLQVSDLGFRTSASLQEIYEAASQVGLTYCSEEVVAQLLIQGCPWHEGKKMYSMQLHIATDLRCTYVISRYRSMLTLDLYRKELQRNHSTIDLFVFVRL